MVVTTARMTIATAVMAGFTGMRKATRPAKKRRRDTWRSRGIISTTVCIWNLFKP
jgi:hypothetical protein